MVKCNDIRFSDIVYEVFFVGLCNILNPYIMFYLSYECQMMVVSNMALHSFNLII